MDARSGCFLFELPFPLRSSAATSRVLEMRVMVLGAGLLGVTSAYFLRQHGHEVTVVDRQATPAAETSFANGGQISVSHAEPWANPSAPLKVLQVAGQGRRAAAVSPPRRHAPVALGLAVPARMHAGAHAAQHRADRAARHLQPRDAAAAARATSASTTTSARKASCISTRARRSSTARRRAGRADARAGLRPALDHRRRGRGDRAGAAPHRAAARGRHLHGRRTNRATRNRFARELVEHCQPRPACDSS